MEPSELDGRERRLRDMVVVRQQNIALKDRLVVGLLIHAF